MKKLIIIAGAFIIIGLCNPAFAGPLSATGFTSFTTGTSVDGQGGWGVSGNFDEEVVADSTGNIVWRVSNAITSGAFGNQPFAPRPGGIPIDTVNNPTNSNPIFFAGESSTGATFDRFYGEFSFISATQASQPGLSVTVSADNGQGARQSFVDLEDNGSGIDVVTYRLKGNGNFLGPFAVAKGLSYTKWHTIGIEVLFKDGTNNDVVRYYVDGKLAQAGPTWEEFYRNFQSNLHPLGVPVQTLLFRISGTAEPAVNGNGYFIDNVVTSTSLR
jgi:hypothetical protein